MTLRLRPESVAAEHLVLGSEPSREEVRGFHLLPARQQHRGRVGLRARLGEKKLVGIPPPSLFNAAAPFFLETKTYHPAQN